MLFWLIIATLTLLALLFALVPLARVPTRQIAPVEYDKAMYKARADEIKRDLSLGRIDEQTANSAIAEESRKLLVSAQVKQIAASNSLAVRRLATILTLIFVPAIGLASYFALGNPAMPDFRLSERKLIDPNTQAISQLIARAESHLAQKPNDAQGWKVLAPIYERMGRFNDAVKAWGHVLRITPQTAGVRANLAEAMVASAEGVVSEDARLLFEKEAALNSSSAKARYYLALAKGQEGKHAEAVSMWDELIDNTAGGPPWIENAITQRNHSAQIAGIKIRPVAGTNSGPSPQQIQDASKMSEIERKEMINSMVAGLAQKLEDDPSNKAGWLRLVRAYQVLGDHESLFKSANEAIKFHAADQAFVSDIEKILAQISQKKPSPDDTSGKKTGNGQ